MCYSTAKIRLWVRMPGTTTPVMMAEKETLMQKERGIMRWDELRP
jgi:hypothetical protein